MHATAKPRKPRPDNYHKVFDSRKRRVRGLWQRNGRYYANLTVCDDLGKKSSRFVPLSGTGLGEAKADYDRLRVERDDDRLRPLGLTPKLSDYFTDSYTKQLNATGKRTSTVDKETGCLGKWCEKLGHLRLNKIRPHHINRVLTDLSEEEYSGRSINLYLIAFRGLIKAAARDGHIKPPLPYEGLQWQRVDQKSRQLYTPAEIEQFCELALQATGNGRQFVDYIRFMQYSGARRSEALRVKWQHVDLNRGTLTVGAEGDSKNRQPRVQDLNPNLEAHLRDMETRKQPDSEWLFPSPQRGNADKPAKTYMESLRLVRNTTGIVCADCKRWTAGEDVAACSHCKSKRIEKKDHLLSPKLRKFAFHDLRHFFISFAVMAGIDFMTIAGWVGHKDGGILIGKVYGHLADEHRKQQAARLTFGPTVITGAAAAA